MTGDRDSGLGHLRSAVGPRLMMHDEYLAEVLDADAGREADLLGQAVHPVHRPRTYLERVEIDAGQLQQRRTEHVTDPAGLLGNKAVRL